MDIVSMKKAFFIAIAFLIIPCLGGTITFDVSKNSNRIQPQNLAGTCLPIFNAPAIYNQIKKGLVQSNYRLFRFPNGSLSNGYHWNGSGSYTADGIWVCDSETFSHGFMSMTLNRGTSVSNWGFNSCSKITDGDTATYWRSDDRISESFPYFYLELPQAVAVDSIEILWGDAYAVDFDIDFFTLSSCPYPGPFQYSEDKWENQKQVTDNGAMVYSTALTGGKSSKYVRVLIKKFKNQEKSVKVREVYLYKQGTQISKDTNSYSGGSPGDQTPVVAMPTFTASTVRSGSAGWTSWHFEAFMSYIKTVSDSAVPVICVNYGTGTPEEAAAWVHYANVVKKYGIRYWQIGNEMDGAWEEGGPVSPKMYAEKFLQFSKAMKGEDSTILVFGPILSNAKFDETNGGLYNGKSWMRTFIDLVGEKEKADGKKYCDGIDFHSYPYWSTSPSAAGLMQPEAVDYIYDRADSLNKWISASLVRPESVFVMLSEFNSMSFNSSLLLKPENGIFAANIYAGMAEKFGSRAMSVFWDSYEDGNVGMDGTFGSLSLFNAMDIWHWSSLTKAPSAAYWALFSAQNLWIAPQASNLVVPAQSISDPAVRAYGISTPADFRALAINTSQSPETLSCSLSVNTYSKADVFLWGPGQFKWLGTDNRAYAYPNCGPVSKSYRAGDIGSIIIPGVSLCVIRYHNPDTTAQAPQFLHLWCYPTTGTTLTLPVCGAVFGGKSPVTDIAYAFDTAKGFDRSFKSLDSSFDGPCESFADSISLKGLKSGQHKLYVRAKNFLGTTSIDSMSFSISELSVKQSFAPIGNGAIQISEMKTSGRIRVAVSGLMGKNANAPLSARIFSISGACVKTLPRLGNNEAIFEWNLDDAARGKAASGAYFLVISSGSAVVCIHPIVNR